MIAPLHLSSTKITEVVAERVADRENLQPGDFVLLIVEDDPTTRASCATSPRFGFKFWSR